jgi:hypothetical protein
VKHRHRLLILPSASNRSFVVVPSPSDAVARRDENNALVLLWWFVLLLLLLLRRSEATAIDFGKRQSSGMERDARFRLERH